MYRAQAPMRFAAILAAACMLCWPALWNHFPLMYADTLIYLRYGPDLARALTSANHHLSPGPRAEFYTLGIYLLDRGRSLWPIVAFNAFVTAYTLWLTVRWVAPRRPIRAYLFTVLLLSLFTGLGWVVGWPLTDLFGSLAYLALLLLVFAWPTHTVAERCALAAIAWWGMAAHPSHLLFGGAVCILCGLLFLTPWMRPRWPQLATAAGLVVFSAISLMGLHAWLYGKPTVMGQHPPYLTARIIADGPGRWYLQGHCPTPDWFLCSRVASLPPTSQGILFDAGGLVALTPVEADLVARQEMPLVLASIRAYPTAELRRAFSNFRVQLRTFSFDDFVHSEWNVRYLDRSIPGQEQAYWRSRQAHNDLPIHQQARRQVALLFFSAAGFALCVYRARARPIPRSLTLMAVLLPVVVLNAAIAGALSQPDSRLQLRVIWLLPLVAILAAHESLEHTAEATSAA